MKRLMLIVLLVFALAGLMPVAAEANPYAERDIYVVQPGDNLSHLAWLYKNDQAKWQEIVDDNPFLDDKGRHEMRGDVHIVWIFPGEKLRGIQKHGIEIMPAKPTSAKKTSVEANSGDYVPKTTGWMIPWWLVVLFVLFALFGAIYYLFPRVMSRWYMGRDPATTGPPIIPGGLRSSQSAEISDRFDQIAMTRHAELYPMASQMVPRPVRIGPIMEGLLSGTNIRVRYASGITQTRTFENQPGFSARFRFHDGSEEEMYFLQRCANDAFRVGEGSEIRFIPRENAAPVAPAPPVRETAAPVPVAEAQTTTITVGGKVLVVPAGSTITVMEDQRVRLTVFSGPAEIIVGNTPPSSRRTPRPAPAVRPPASSS